MKNKIRKYLREKSRITLKTLIKIVYMFIFPVIFISIILAYSCSDSAVNSNREVFFPDSNVSFQEHVQPFLRITCSYAGCHNDYNPGYGAYPITDYFNIFSSYLGLVVSGKPDQSRMVQTIEKTLPHFGNERWNIPDNHKKGIRKWIQEGAKYN
ncbi:MAG: hypothetical protein QG635_2048 [Bacteroidota bacterium]|nr:hypothetical protein [Bacteroidota bacterium]